MLSPHGSTAQKQPRKWPLRSGCGGSATIQPAAIRSSPRTLAWPAPSSTTRMPSGASRRRASRGDRRDSHQGLSAAVERHARIVIAHFRAPAPRFAAGDIGRIGDDEIERAAQAPRHNRRRQNRARSTQAARHCRARRASAPILTSVPTPNAFGNSATAPAAARRSRCRDRRCASGMRAVARIAASAASTTVSVSGRGTSVAGVTPNAQSPEFLLCR